MAEGHPRRKQILLVLCLSLLAGVIDNTVLNTALPTLARVLHAGTSSLQWIVDGYTLCFAALLIPPERSATATAVVARSLVDSSFSPSEPGGLFRPERRSLDRRSGAHGPRSSIRDACHTLDPECRLPAA